MLVIRLARFGKKNHATFRVVVMDHKKAADAAPVERLGHYDPHKETDAFVVDKERVEYWLNQGVQVTTTVASHLEKLGVEAPIRVRKKKTTKPRVKEESEETSATEAPKEEKKEDAPAEASEEKTEEPKEEAVEEKKSEKKAAKEEVKEESKEEKKEEKEAPKEEKKPEEGKK